MNRGPTGLQAIGSSQTRLSKNACTACLHPCPSFLLHRLVLRGYFICSADITVSGHSIILSVLFQLCIPWSVGLGNECRRFRCGVPSPDQSTAVVLILDSFLLLRLSKVTVAFTVMMGTVLTHGMYTANEVYMFFYIYFAMYIYICMCVYVYIRCCWVKSSQAYTWGYVYFIQE